MSTHFFALFYVGLLVSCAVYFVPAAAFFVQAWSHRRRDTAYLLFGISTLMVASYTACPALRYHDGFYYMFYLEQVPLQTGGVCYETYLVRTPDFLDWQLSPLNPVLSASDDDRTIC